MIAYRIGKKNLTFSVKILLYDSLVGFDSLDISTSLICFLRHKLYRWSYVFLKKKKLLHSVFVGFA